MDPAPGRPPRPQNGSRKRGYNDWDDPNAQNGREAGCTLTSQARTQSNQEPAPANLLLVFFSSNPNAKCADLAI
jgi:hypothetical protein